MSSPTRQLPTGCVYPSHHRQLGLRQLLQRAACLAGVCESVRVCVRTCVLKGKTGRKSDGQRGREGGRWGGREETCVQHVCATFTASGEGGGMEAETDSETDRECARTV